MFDSYRCSDVRQNQLKINCCFNKSVVVLSRIKTSSPRVSRVITLLTASHVYTACHRLSQVTKASRHCLDCNWLVHRSASNGLHGKCIHQQKALIIQYEHKGIGKVINSKRVLQTGRDRIGKRWSNFSYSSLGLTVVYKRKRKKTRHFSTLVDSTLFSWCSILLWFQLCHSSLTRAGPWLKPAPSPILAFLNCL